MELASFHNDLTQRFTGLNRSAVLTYPGSQYVSVGFETHNNTRAYRWDGLKRGADPQHPFVLFQFTVHGSGIFSNPMGARIVGPGCAFAVVIPSEHIYYLPDGSDPWTFFWLIIQQPYIVSRLHSKLAEFEAVFDFSPADPIVSRAVRLMDAVQGKTFRDAWALEMALFELLLEFERHIQHDTYPKDRHDEMTRSVRDYVLARSNNLVKIEELAKHFGESRCHFSRKFKDVTGTSPAQYVRQVLFDEAVRKLLETDDKLEKIAQSTGFANANHFCKVFRRRLHISPAAFRRQV